MKPVDVKKGPVTIKAETRDEEGKKHIEKVELDVHKVDTLKHVQRKLVDKGVQRMERHPSDGSPYVRPPPKSGHGGKYTWEGPAEEAENELDPAPVALDERDPNYVDEEAEEKVVKGEDEEVAGLVVGEVEVAKAAEAREGVARIEVIDPHLKE
ncbi:hypothetical protein Vadar_030350 [Vaccinium darrowii]|uniref:Uncharacterized protein n=1 Tax=Vaccinium darrowii TaxID=229202 RepID=A0ACB7Z8K9_9ERIC|nr:hypothetical protein Vadar_030350 [Vaccinium darrowii]